MERTIEEALALAHRTGRDIYKMDAEQTFDAASVIVELLAPFCERADISDDEMDDLDADLRKRPGKYDESFRVDL